MKGSKATATEGGVARKNNMTTEALQAVAETVTKAEKRQPYRRSGCRSVDKQEELEPE